MPNHTPTVLRRRAHWHCTKDTYGVTTFCRVRHRFMGTARQHNYGETAHLFLTGIATCYLGREGCDETRRAHEVEWTKAKTLAALRGGAPIGGGSPTLAAPGEPCVRCGATDGERLIGKDGDGTRMVVCRSHVGTGAARPTGALAAWSRTARADHRRGRT